MRVGRLTLAMVLLVGGLFVGPATTAFACSRPTTGMRVSGDAADGGASCKDRRDGNGQKDTTQWTKGGQPPLCVWAPAPAYPAQSPEPVAGPDGQWYAKFCKFGQFKTLTDFEAEMATWDESMSTARGDLMKRAGIEYQFFKTPPSARPTAEQVMHWVAATLPFPQTYVATSPKAASNTVNFPTWIWLVDGKGAYNPAAYAVKSKEIQLFGYGLRWQIVPTVDLDPGDGGVAPSCAGIGVPWSESADESAACTVSYSKSGKYTLTATVGWTVQWWLSGAQQPDLTGPDQTATLPITVNEIQVVSR